MPSCETTLVNLTENWKSASIRRNPINRYMSKAFDSLHPPLMLSKLRANSMRTLSILYIAPIHKNKQYSYHQLLERAALSTLLNR